MESGSGLRPEAFGALEAGDPPRVGRYRIIARLGAGGMGRVYLGRSPSGRAVAVKVVRPELAEDGEFRRRFTREVAAARRVNGFFTAGVVDADPDGSPAWLATAYVPGVSLGEAVAAHGPWPVDSVLALGAGLAEALEAIHAVDVVHRDLKPSNVLLAADGPRVIDFGISASGEASALTRTGMMVGTPGFMSPEQLTGNPIGPASDVFSLGAVLTFVATGHGPFGIGSAHALHFRAVYEEPELTSVPPGLRDVISGCLVKDPKQRPSVAALLNQLAGSVDGRDTTAVPFEAEWLPAPVAASVRTRAVAPQPATPPPMASEPAPSAPSGPATPALEAGGTTSAASVQPALPVRPHPPTEAAAREAGVGTPDADDEPALHRAPTRTGRRPVSGTAQPQASSGAAARPAPGKDGPAPTQIDAGEGAPRVSRRRALFGLVGATAAAGLGFTGWRFLGGPDLPEHSLAWKFTTGDHVTSAPAVVDGVAYIGSADSQVYAVDASTGKAKWSYATGGTVLTPAVAHGMVYVGSGDRQVHALDATTGTKKWSFTTDGAVYTSPAVYLGSVFVGSNDTKVYALDATTGELQWSYTTGDQVQSSPVVVDGMVYVGSDDARLYALNSTTGEKNWSFTAGNAILSAPTVVSGGSVYFSGGDRTVYALDAGTGAKKWRYTTGDTPGTPTVRGGNVYVYSHDGNVHALDAATGVKKWTFPTEAGASTPAVAGKVVYVGSYDGSLYALDATTGAPQWRFRADDIVRSPVVLSDFVYFGSDDKNLYAVPV
ncbi:serine/threonine-protein kinase AfsK [Streptomyces scabiei]|uniref:Serine/threonine-protein kinase AfsK n=1 Tax=Streptomyces scabiei TaxID=1930 RepID=A0A100JNE7_STRSC|nr:serine/threonine-protein kinase AfsK [Streptomyces scabiei]